MTQAKNGFPDHDPRSKINGEDAKIVDEKGLAVVEGKPWSEVPTGIYLALVHLDDPEWMADRRLLALRHIGERTKLVITHGKVKFNTGFYGAAIELPSDLSSDALKRKYLGEWLGSTWAEIVMSRDLDVDASMAMLHRIMHDADVAIRKVGF